MKSIKKKRNRTFIGACLATLFGAIVLGLTIASNGFSFASAFFTRSTPIYQLTLDSTNKVTSSGDKVQKTALGNDVTFTYSGVNSSTTGHVTLNNGGTLENKDWLRSITAFTCTYSGGTLTAKSSYGGDVWNAGFTVESGKVYETGSNPYFIKFTASETVTITSIVYQYNCLVNAEAHEDEEVGDGLLGVIDFWNVNNAGNTNGNSVVTETYVDDRSFNTLETGKQSKDLVDDVNATTVFQNRYGGIGFGSNNNAASLVLTLVDGIEPTSVTVIAGSQTPTKTLTLNDVNKNVTANCTDITALNSTYTNTLTWTFNSAVNELEFSTSKSVKIAIYRIYLYGQTGPTFNEPKDFVGFSVTDSKLNKYETTETFDTVNGLSVKANYSDGTQTTINKGGVDGYSYEVYNALDEKIDTSKPFGGQDNFLYRVVVSFKDYIPVEYITYVNFIVRLTEIEVNSDNLSFNTAQKLSDYTDVISANLKYNKAGMVDNDVAYSEFSEHKLALSLLDPSGNTYPITSAFATAGRWNIKVASTEDSTIYGTLEIDVAAIQVTSVTVSGSATSLEVDGHLQLTAAVLPDNATNKTVNWTSSNTSIAAVNNNGYVTGVSEGDATITATAADGSAKYGYIDINVTPKPEQTEFDATLARGTSPSFDVTVNGHTGVRVNTSSDFTGNATITVGKGATKLTFYVAGWWDNSGTISLSPSVGSVGSSSIGITGDSKVSGNTNTFTLNESEDTYYKEVSLSNITSDSVITISSSGRFVIWGAMYHTTKVDPVYPTSISLTGDDSVTIGNTIQLSVGYSPNTTTVKEVTYTSNATGVATVSPTGVVTGVSAGSAKITATARAGSGNQTVTAEKTITVSDIHVSSVSLNKSQTTLLVGANETLSATISPSNASNKNVTWSTSDSSVADVNDGVVTGVKAGSAIITVTTVDGSKTATCSVTIVSNSGGGQSGVSGTLTIAVNDIPKTYNTSDNNTSVGGFGFTAYNAAYGYVNGMMQWKKSSGYLENVSAIEGLSSITIGEASGKSFSGTLYSGNASSPSSNSQAVTSGHTYTFTGTPTYFRLVVGSATGYTGDISLTYSTTPVAPTSISLSSNSLEIAPGGTKDLSVTYSPSNANTGKEITWSRYSGSSNISVSSSGTVSVSSNASAGNTAVIRATLTNNSNVYASCTVTVTEVSGDDQTILIYICGSDLESNGQTSSSSASGYASGDITEILKASNQPDDVNVVIETGGAKCWKTTHGINKDYLSRYHVENKQLVRDSLESKANMGSSTTLQSFITWGVQNYPADRISLILWNHGGAMRGVCYDENYSSDSLTNSEVKTALRNSFSTLGRSASEKFEWIGYDACLMQVQDIAEFNSEYFKYMVASEESESGSGWKYDTWLAKSFSHSSTETILTSIADSFLSSVGGTSSDQTLSWLRLANIANYKSKWETMSSTIKSMIGTYGKTNFQTLMKTCKCYGSDSDCEGYSYFGILDAKDVLNKLKATSAFSDAFTQIDEAIAAFDLLVGYSTVGRKAGNSYGLCCFFPMTDGSGYTCNTNSVYTSSQTNFTNWRSIVTSYGS